MSMSQNGVSVSGPEFVARAFHEAYESLAPMVGYETRRESAVAWDDVSPANRRLMVKTVTRLLHEGAIEHGPNGWRDASQAELRKAWALTLADALQWTENPTQMQLGLIREGALRLARDDALTLHEEGEFQRALLESGCRLTGPFRCHEAER